MKRFRIEIDIETDDDATVETVRTEWASKVTAREWRAIKTTIVRTHPEGLL